MSDTGAPQVKEDTVEALVTQVRELLRVEDAREESFTTRAGTAAGFCGLIVSVSAAVGASAFKPGLAVQWEWAAAGLLAVVLALLLLDIVVIVFGVLMPKESVGFAMAEVARYPMWEFISQERARMQGRILHGLIEVLAVDRRRNARKATHLRRAYTILVMAVGALSSLAAILGLHAHKVI